MKKFSARFFFENFTQSFRRFSRVNQIVPWIFTGPELNGEKITAIFVRPSDKKILKLLAPPVLRCGTTLSPRNVTRVRYVV